MREVEVDEEGEVAEEGPDVVKNLSEVDETNPSGFCENDVGWFSQLFGKEELNLSPLTVIVLLEDVLLDVVDVQMRDVELEDVVWPSLSSWPGKRGALGGRASGEICGPVL